MTPEAVLPTEPPDPGAWAALVGDGEAGEGAAPPNADDAGAFDAAGAAVFEGADEAAVDAVDEGRRGAPGVRPGDGMLAAACPTPEDVPLSDELEEDGGPAATITTAAINAAARPAAGVQNHQ